MLRHLTQCPRLPQSKKKGAKEPEGESEPEAAPEPEPEAMDVDEDKDQEKKDLPKVPPNRPMQRRGGAVRRWAGVPH